MVASIGAVAAPSQGASYYERDGYYAKDDPDHRAASAWAGRGAEELGLKGPVDPDAFKAILEGRVPDGSETRLGRRGKDGEFHHRPGRDLTFSAPKSVSLAALVGGDARIVDAHDRAVGRALGWFEKNVAETRMKDPETGGMIRTGGQKTVIATFQHDTSRNLDPALHTHSVIANMVLGDDGKWRTMANERLYRSKMLLGALYRSEIAGELAKLGYGIEKTHADGRFEIAGVSREIIEAFSTRRAEIEAAMEARGFGSTAQNQHLARRAALMTRAHKRDVDKGELRETWAKQAADLGFDTPVPDRDPGRALTEAAMERSRDGPEIGRDAVHHREPNGKAIAELGPLFAHAEAHSDPARDAVDWALAHLSERDAVFSKTDLFAAALAYSPGAATVEAIERTIEGLKREGRLHDAPALAGGDGLATDKTVAEERETVGLMRDGAGRGKAAMRGWMVDAHLRKGPLTSGQKQAVRLILSAKDRTVGVQGYAGTGKTRMLNRARTLAEKKGFRMLGLAPSASAVQTLAAESGIESETLQRFLARNAGVTEGRLTRKGAKEMRAAFAKTVLVVDEGSLASTVQARHLLRIANILRIPKLVLVGDAKQLDAVDAGKPFAQLQQAGMQTATMDEIMRQRDPELKAAVEASLKGDVGRAFEKLGQSVAEVKADNIAGAVAARWLKLSAEERANTGIMAPTHELRQEINGHIRERLAREGRIVGPAMQTERLVSRGYTNAEKALAANYAPGDTVAFHRPYKRLGVQKGDERRVAGVDHRKRSSASRRPGQRDRGLEAVRDRRPPGRHGSLPERGHRAARRRSHPLDPQRCRSRPGQHRLRRDHGHPEGPGRVPSRGRTKDGTRPERSPASASRPCLGLDRARVSGAYGGQCDRRDGGKPSSSDDGQGLLCRDFAGTRPGGAGHRRCAGTQGTARSGHRRTYFGARRHRRSGPAQAFEGRRSGSQEGSTGPRQGGATFSRQGNRAGPGATKGAGARTARQRQAGRDGYGLVGPDLTESFHRPRRQTTPRNRSRRAFVHGLDHDAAGRGDDLVELALAVGAEKFLAPERGQHVDGAEGRLNEREVSGRNRGWQRRGEPLPRRGEGPGADDLAGGNPVPQGRILY